MNDPKPWFTSRVLWANIVAGAVVLAGAFGVDFGLTPETQAELVAGIMIAVNIVLRFMTKAPIG
jgi:hypothetical protein